MMKSLALGAALLALPAVAGADEPQRIPVVALASAPSVDGNLAEWGTGGWLDVGVTPAVLPGDRARLGLDGEDRNATGIIRVRLKAGVAGGRLYLAARWPDKTADMDYKGWEWNGTKYTEAKRREDMFAVRFHKEGDFDRSMLAGKSYVVDVWLWSAARTNGAGLAEDGFHQISVQPLEDAAEYEVKGVGTVYIRKNRDAGNPIYRAVRPPRDKGPDQLPSVEPTGKASGSVADVEAKGRWQGGYWQLELARRLDTGHGDDVAFVPGRTVLGQIAVFNHGGDEHKSVSEPLLFDFSGLR